MSEQYYLRVRGRVLGPYDHEKLQSLAQRGQLSRMHEVSIDGVTWARATSYPDLFTGSTLPTVTAPAGNGSSSPPSTTDEYRVAAPPQESNRPAVNWPPHPSAQKWLYISGGVECGPVEFSELQVLTGTGQVGPEDQIWSNGMPAWISAAQVPGLFRTGGTRGTSAVPTASSDQSLPESLSRAAGDSRTWAFFIAILGFVFAALQVLGGIGLLMAGAQGRSTLVVAQGIFFLINALLIVIAGALLSSYASRLGGLRYNRSVIVLEKSLESLRSFWIFISIYMIVVMAFIGVVVIYAIAAGATLPSWEY